MPLYRFTTGEDTAGDPESEDKEFDSDTAAEEHARHRSRAGNAAVTVRRHSAHVDAWEYVAEADERE